MSAVDAILLAAGAGTRARLGYPKQLARLGGRPLFIHAVELLAGLPEIAKIVMAVPPGQIDAFAQVLGHYGRLNGVLLIEGGPTRQQSVRLALERVDTDWVLIHEAVRPFVTPAHVREILSVAAGQSAVTPVAPISETVLIRPMTYPARSGTVRIQLPQAFHTSLLRQAHERAVHNCYTEDTSLVCAVMGIAPFCIEGLDENIKVTTPLDIALAEVIFRERGGGDGS